MKTLKTITLITICLVFINCNAQKSEASIKDAIKNMVKGKDAQDGTMIAKGFWEDAAIFATRGPEILTVPVKQFVDLHQSKKLGGHDRNYKIEEISINEAGVASAKVTAQDKKVHYEYHLGFTKKQGEWRIQTYLQHSKIKK